jgi:hypothetical protein
MLRYLREAFFAGPDIPGLGRLPINALVVAACAVFGFVQPGFWFLGLGLEAAYLFALSTNARFQRAVDAAAMAAPDEDLERKRRALLDQLSGDDRSRIGAIDGKCERLAQLNASADDGLPATDAEAVARLRWMCLKLLFARKTLRDQGGDAQAQVVAQVAQLRKDLAGDLAPSLRESKAATLEVLTRRLESLRRREESLAEIDSDLTRLEAQLDLAIDNAAMRGKPIALGPSLDLVGRLLDADAFGDARDVVADLDQAYPAGPGKPPAQPTRA